MTSPAPFLFATGIENSYPRVRSSVPPRSSVNDAAGCGKRLSGNHRQQWHPIEGYRGSHCTFSE